MFCAQAEVVSLSTCKKLVVPNVRASSRLTFSQQRLQISFGMSTNVQAACFHDISCAAEASCIVTSTKVVRKVGVSGTPNARALPKACRKAICT
jgi:hypothetical protein